MLKFLRKFRRNIVASGSIQKYLLYAVGEILLVMIGILLALQVNTWKNNRELQKTELSTLHELSEALVQDTLTIDASIRSMRNSWDHTLELLEHIENQRPYGTRLDTMFARSYVFHTPAFNKFSTVAFELLKERGTDIISNPRLRREIVEHYSNNYAEITGWFANIIRMHSLEADRLYDNFKIDQEKMDGGTTLHPRDYEQLLADESILYPFYHFKSLIGSSINRLNHFNNQTKYLLEQINTEIESLKKE